ncbi:hypothetical protein M514_20473 [Trichuris suis]|uniref:Uncharacterized protein n=1 Tax=Trichuris suis TaxID=68888 RepID=A0A085ND91_9BILA|nr:hypothetical protein M514_20473 [Trichuris suis]
MAVTRCALEKTRIVSDLGVFQRSISRKMRRVPYHLLNSTPPGVLKEETYAVRTAQTHFFYFYPQENGCTRWMLLNGSEGLHDGDRTVDLPVLDV